MNKLIVTSLFITAMSATSFHAAANYSVDAKTEKKLVRVCQALQSGSQLQLHKAIKATRNTYSAIANNLVCNGQDAITFAIQNNALQNARYLAQRSSIDLEGNQLYTQAFARNEQ